MANRLLPNVAGDWRGDLLWHRFNLQAFARVLSIFCSEVCSNCICPWDSAEWLPINLKKLPYDFVVELNSEFKIGDSRTKATFLYKRSKKLRAVHSFC